MSKVKPTAPPEAAPADPPVVAEAEAVAALTEPLVFLLRLRQDAVLGEGNRDKGALLGSCERHPDISRAEVSQSLVDSRWIGQEVQKDGSLVISYVRDHGDRKAGDPVCRIVPEPGVAVRECVNLLRNPNLMGG